MHLKLFVGFSNTFFHSISVLYCFPAFSSAEAIHIFFSQIICIANQPFLSVLQYFSAIQQSLCIAPEIKNLFMQYTPAFSVLYTRCRKGLRPRSRASTQPPISYSCLSICFRLRRLRGPYSARTAISYCHHRARSRSLPRKRRCRQVWLRGAARPEM